MSAFVPGDAESQGRDVGGREGGREGGNLLQGGREGGRDSAGYATDLPSNPEVEVGIGFLAAAETCDVMVPALVKSATMDL
jgi:hypothetical protein